MDEKDSVAQSAAFKKMPNAVQSSEILSLPQ
jgi:hypothetical protein